MKQKTKKPTDLRQDWKDLAEDEIMELSKPLPVKTNYMKQLKTILQTIAAMLLLLAYSILDKND